MNGVTALGVAVVVVLVSLSGATHAGMLAVANHDFESDGTTDGAIGSGGGIPTSWDFTGTGTPGAFNPSTGQPHYTAMGDGDPNGGVLANMDGPTFGFMFPGDGSTGELSQTLSDTLQANTTYTLTAAFGLRNYFNGGQVPSDFRLALETMGGSVVAEITADILNGNPSTPGENSSGSISLVESTFTDFAAMASTDAAPAGLGETLVIRIQALADGRYLDVDNVRLDATAVPEPSAVGLLLVGFASLMGIQRIRKG